MPTPFAGAAASDATNVPWNSPGPETDCVFRNVVSGLPANSGCVGSTPLSTIVIGTPGPGGVARSAPTAASHHSCACIGSGAVEVAAVAEAHAQRPTTSTTGRRRPKARPSVASLPAVPRAYVGL